MIEEKDLSYIPLADLMRHSDSIYKLVIMAARRAVEISEGSPKLVDINPKVKASTVALEEIKMNKVNYKILEGEK